MPTTHTHHPFVFRSRLGKRIVVLLIVVSSIFTLITTASQFYFDYQEQFELVHKRHKEVENIHVGLLADSLWNFDLALLNQRLDGLVNLSNIDYLELKTDKYSFSAGSAVSGDMIRDVYPVQYATQSSSPTALGWLVVESGLAHIYETLWQQFFSSLALNLFKTLLICALILWIFDRSINQRIEQIVDYLRRFTPTKENPRLSLSSPPLITHSKDEISVLGRETYRLATNLTHLYKDIQYEQERMSGFASVSSDWLWETDEHHRLTYCSSAMRQTLGIEELSKAPLFQLPALTHAIYLYDTLEQKQDFDQLEIYLPSKRCELLFRAKAIFINGMFAGYRGAAIDITELKAAHRRLRDINANLEQTVLARTAELETTIDQLTQAQEQLIESEKLAALGGLVAGVAHEVNTPLGIAVTSSSIFGETLKELDQAFQNQTLTSEQFSELIGQQKASHKLLEQNLARAAKLIADFKRTAVDQVSENLSEFSVAQVVEALIASLHPETRKVPVTPQLDIAEKITMNSLPGVLTQIISNLVMNSVFHAFDDQPKPTILIRALEKDDEIELHYEDNGCGIDAALHHKIFEPFYTTKRGQGGSGLGLNIVFNLITIKLKGKLEFHSELGDGVHYIITLPKQLT